MFVVCSWHDATNNLTGNSNEVVPSPSPVGCIVKECFEGASLSASENVRCFAEGSAEHALTICTSTRVYRRAD